MRVAGVLALVLVTTGVVLRDCAKCQARTRNRPMEYFQWSRPADDIVGLSTSLSRHMNLMCLASEQDSSSSSAYDWI